MPGLRPAPFVLNATPSAPSPLAPPGDAAPAAWGGITGDIEDQGDLQTAFNGYAASGHNHAGVYAVAAHNHDGTYAAAGHNHAGVYAPAAHNHDAAYSAIAHNHDGAYAAIGHAHAGVYAPVAAVPNASYRTILDCTASHIAARVAGTYWLGQGQPAGITGTGTLYAPNLIYITAADFPTLDGVAPKLRIRAQLYTNDVAPTGNYTFGLYPVTRPGTSGGAGLCIYAMGTVVAGSNGAVFTGPAADGLHQAVGADFAVPANGHYVLGFVSTANVAANAHVQISASLQMRNA